MTMFIPLWSPIILDLCRIPNTTANTSKKGINMVIALSIAMLAITSYDFRNFFRILFPYTGIGVAILLVGMILTGLFVDSDKNWWRYVFYGIGMFIALVVVFSALTSYTNWGLGSWWWREYVNSIVVALVVIGLILLVVLATKD
jgi:hypothetical protein